MTEITSTRTWNYREAAEYLGLSISTLKHKVSVRTVPHIRIGKLVRFRKSDLDKFLDENLVDPAT